MGRIGFLLSVIVVGIFLTSSSALVAKTNVLFIVDFSGSMNEPFGVGNPSKIDAAEKAFQESMFHLDPSINIGLMEFGRQISRNPSLPRGTPDLVACADIELSSFGQKARADLVKEVIESKAKGETPIAASLLRAKDQFSDRGDDDNHVILITDGREECGGDVCNAANELVAMRIGLKADVVGLAHSDADRRAVECVANITQGIYAPAKNAKDITDAINVAVSGCQVSRLSGDMREWVHDGAIRVTLSEIIPGGQYQGQYRLLANIENCTGKGIGIAFDLHNPTVGPCAVRIDGVAGLQSFGDRMGIEELRKQPNPSQLLQWFLSGEKRSGIVTFSPTNCGELTKGKPVTVNIGVVFADDKNVAYVQHGADDVPVK